MGAPLIRRPDERHSRTNRSGFESPVIFLELCLGQSASACWPDGAISANSPTARGGKPLRFPLRFGDGGNRCRFSNRIFVPADHRCRRRPTPQLFADSNGVRRGLQLYQLCTAATVRSAFRLQQHQQSSAQHLFSCTSRIDCSDSRNGRCGLPVLVAGILLVIVTFPWARARIGAAPRADREPHSSPLHR